ncbi:hypothetical protein B0A48_11783 [Cryoendolithus antarcticus]|uniref:Uncharacterized protein n=1 Tax=Cryoendolithus antarcticus TaxID=1507870 RepID=A0A1V8ST41_9PEZI|nr:hypothetical protein B0A48_11783 [Cryoendolithus antarcticus]
MSTATYPPRTPTTTITQTRAKPATGVSPQATRSLHAPGYQHSLSSAPASQESITSNGSTRCSVVQRLQTSSSNVSQLTDYTDFTSPASSRPSYEEYGGWNIDVQSGDHRVRTPEVQVVKEDVLLASPMNIASPLTNGTKRTASGHVKNAPSVTHTPLGIIPRGGRSRAESMSSTGGRAGELAASLKTRLGYAMVKVQHGLEHKTFAEVERIAAPKTSPNRYSMPNHDYARRPVSSGLSNGTARLSIYSPDAQRIPYDDTAPPPSKRHSASFAALAPGFSHQQSYPYDPSPRLQPAPDLKPTNGFHTYSSQQYSMSPPSTPHTRPERPRPLRTDTQTAEAERDALQALFQLGSPHTSQISRQHASQESSAHGSPLRIEHPTPRRVTFARSESGSGEGSEGGSAGDIGRAF